MLKVNERGKRAYQCVRLSLLAIALLSAACTEEQQSQARKEAERLVEQGRENQLQAALTYHEQMGLAGSKDLKLSEVAAPAYQAFTTALRSNSRVTILDADAVAANPTYKRLAAAHSTKSDRSLAADVYRHAEEMAVPSTVGKIDRPLRVAVIEFMILNGGSRPALGGTRSCVLKITQAQLAELAASLNADLLVSADIRPFIAEISWQDAFSNGEVTAHYHARAYNARGELVAVVNNPMLQFRRIRITKNEIPWLDAAFMGLLEVGFLFPTEGQRQQVAAIERRLVRE